MAVLSRVASTTTFELRNRSYDPILRHGPNNIVPHCALTDPAISIMHLFSHDGTCRKHTWNSFPTHIPFWHDYPDPCESWCHNVHLITQPYYARLRNTRSKDAGFHRLEVETHTAAQKSSLWSHGSVKFITWSHTLFPFSMCLYPATVCWCISAPDWAVLDLLDIVDTHMGASCLSPTWTYCSHKIRLWLRKLHEHLLNPDLWTHESAQSKQRTTRSIYISALGISERGVHTVKIQQTAS